MTSVGTSVASTCSASSWRCPMDKDTMVTREDDSGEKHATTGGSAAAGAVTGGVAGAIAGGPAGAAVGAVGGAIMGALASASCTAGQATSTSMVMRVTMTATTNT